MWLLSLLSTLFLVGVAFLQRRSRKRIEPEPYIPTDKEDWDAEYFAATGKSVDRGKDYGYVPPSSSVRGSFTTLHSPGLNQLLGGGYPSALGGMLGGLGAAGYGAAQQQLSAAEQVYRNAQLQQSAMMPDTTENNINLLAQQNGHHGVYIGYNFGLSVDNSDLMKELDAKHKS